MNTTNPKLDDVLDKFGCIECRSFPYDEDVAQAKQTILSDLMDIVGEDEPEEYYTKRMGRMVAHPHKENWAKNRLRAQLKRAIRAYVGVES